MSFQGGRLSGKATIEEAFNRYQNYVEQLEDSSGTFAAKGVGLIRIEDKWNPKSAKDHCMGNNTYREPPYIYELEDGWWIGGWCAE